MAVQKIKGGYHPPVIDGDIIIGEQDYFSSGMFHAKIPSAGRTDP
jgi:hypothetical protein